MSWIQIILTYLIGLSVSVFVRALFIPRPKDGWSADQMIFNTLIPLAWPVSLPVNLAYHLGRLFRGEELPDPPTVDRITPSGEDLKEYDGFCPECDCPGYICINPTMCPRSAMYGPAGIAGAVERIQTEFWELGRSDKPNG